jgi:hypothetical protein
MKLTRLEQRIVELAQDPIEPLDIFNQINKERRWFWQKVSLVRIYLACYDLVEKGYLRDCIKELLPGMAYSWDIHYVATDKTKGKNE